MLMNIGKQGACALFSDRSRFADDLKEMTGRSLSIYWEITLKYLSPMLIVGVWCTSVAMRIMQGIQYHPYDSETVKFPLLNIRAQGDFCLIFRELHIPLLIRSGRSSSALDLWLSEFFRLSQSPSCGDLAVANGRLTRRRLSEDWRHPHRQPCFYGMLLDLNWTRAAL